MQQVFSKISIIFLTTFFAAALLISTSKIFAEPVSTEPSIDKNLCGGAATLQFGDNSGTSCEQATQGAEEKVNDLVGQIINIFSIIVGIVAVIMIIVGGFRYITSGGDSGNVSSAKNTILYAIIGLIIVALAQFIVKFVLSKATGN